MAFTTITKPAVGDATKKSLADAIIDDLADLNTRVNSSFGDKTIVSNGSFEYDTDSDGVPDGWTKALLPSGAFAITGNALSDTVCSHGARAVKMTSTGTGGATLTSSTFFECSPNRPLAFTWQYYSTAAAVANKVQVAWYTAAQSLISTDTIWSASTNNPSAWTDIFANAIPAATARYAKLIVTGCDTTSGTSGSTYYDNFYVTPLDFQRWIEFDGTMTIQTYHWLCPAGVSTIEVISIAGGGGGGGVGTSMSYGGGGGGGGSMTRDILQVSPGTKYDVTVGFGGTLGSNAGNPGGNGGDSKFNTTQAIAKGGTGGAGGTTGAAGAGGIAGTGYWTIVGTPGGAGTAAADGGDGGSSLMGKCGGMGGYSSGSAQGNAPNAYCRGAGGGGAFRATTTAGGAGGPGAVIIRY